MQSAVFCSHATAVWARGYLAAVFQPPARYVAAPCYRPEADTHGDHAYYLFVTRCDPVIYCACHDQSGTSLLHDAIARNALRPVQDVLGAFHRLQPAQSLKLSRDLMQNVKI